MRSSSTAKSAAAGSQPPADPQPPTGLLEVGRITKPHGLTGEVAVRPITNRPGRFDPPSVFDSPLGKLNITSSRLHNDRWLVHFAEATDRTAAEKLAGCPLWAAPIADTNQLWVHELIACKVVDQHGIDRGQVVTVQQNPAADLLELSDGHLVPVTFVVATKPGLIEIDAPDGLFDLNAT